MVMRHGEAEAPTADDFNRKLTHDGEVLVAKACRSIRDNHLHRDDGSVIELERLLASPLVRAQQTALIVANCLIPGLELETWDEISPSGDCKVVSQRLNASGEEIVLMVSHQPFVSMFIEYLTGREVSMGTASVAGIHAEVLGPKLGELEWLQTA